MQQRQPLGDSGLANARLADKHWIVLLAARRESAIRARSPCSRPITGSSFPSPPSFVRSRPKLSSTGVLDFFSDGDVEGAERLCADAAGRLEAVAHLKAPHAFGDCFVIVFAGFVPSGHVFGDDKTPAQQGYVGPACARRELGIGGQARPAAAYLDGRIAEQRLLDALVGALVEHGVGRQRQCRGRARLRRRRRASRLRAAALLAALSVPWSVRLAAARRVLAAASREQVAGWRSLDAGRAGSAGR